MDSMATVLDPARSTRGVRAQPRAVAEGDEGTRRDESERTVRMIMEMEAENEIDKQRRRKRRSKRGRKKMEKRKTRE
jgi:hypothetical protein